MAIFDPTILHPELKYKAVRSSGKGGQHVNKVASKVELYFDINSSFLLSDEQKELLYKNLAGRINSAGVLLIDSQESRSQFRNKEIVTRKFNELVSKALKKKKKRLATRPTVQSAIRRLDSKKKHAEKKTMRKKEW